MKYRNFLWQYVLAIGAFSGYLIGLGQPLIVLWSESTMLNVVKQYNPSLQNVTMSITNFQTISQGSMWLGLQSIAFCMFATVCLTMFFVRRKYALNDVKETMEKI